MAARSRKGAERSGERAKRGACARRKRKIKKWGPLGKAPSNEHGNPGDRDSSLYNERMEGQLNRKVGR